MTEPDYTNKKIWAYPGKSWIALAKETEAMPNDYELRIQYPEGIGYAKFNTTVQEVRANAWATVSVHFPESFRDVATCRNELLTMLHHDYGKPDKSSAYRFIELLETLLDSLK